VNPVSIKKIMPMERDLTAKEVKALLARLKESVEKEECWSCDCLQGLLTQIELDATGDITHLTAPFVVPNEKMHPCLGCEPCPPGAIFADYIRSKKNQTNM
jgi:hypothetical protein